MNLFDDIYNGLPGYPCAWSSDRRYRYTLWRIWSGSVPQRVLMIIGLNPSIADETSNDNTVRRCITFAQREKCDALLMTNAFAWVDTDPGAMKKAGAAAIGPENDAWLIRCAGMSSVVVAAWGVHGNFLGRDVQLKKLIPNLMCFGTTKHGMPKHPLYLPSSMELIPYIHGGNHENIV